MEILVFLSILTAALAVLSSWYSNPAGKRADRGDRRRSG